MVHVFIAFPQARDSTPCLLPTPPRGDAVGTVFGAEPSNSTGGTLARVDARFTGAPNVDSAEKGAVLVRFSCNPLRSPGMVPGEHESSDL